MNRIKEKVNLVKTSMATKCKIRNCGREKTLKFFKFCVVSFFKRNDIRGLFKILNGIHLVKKGEREEGRSGEGEGGDKRVGEGDDQEEEEECSGNE